jgi:hypothetical protein
MKVWLAVVDGRFGYALDLYPEERDRLRELGCAVVGEFTKRQEAIDAAVAALTSCLPGHGAPSYLAGGSEHQPPGCVTPNPPASTERRPGEHLRFG